jgi:hypothetical protein
MPFLEKLSLPMLDLLGEYTKISREDKDMLLEHQARLLAIHWGQKESPEFAQKDLRKAPRFGKDNPLAMKSEMARLEIGEEEISKARKVVISKAGMPPEVPPIGKIAIDMDLIEPELLDCLIVIQTGIYLLKTSQKFSSLDCDQGASDIDHLYRMIVEQTDTGQFARSFIGAYDDDSKLTISSQALLHMLDLSHAIFCTKPSLVKSEAVEKMRYICEAIAYQVILSGAGLLADMGRLSDARDIILEIPDDHIELTQNMLDNIQDFILQNIQDFKNEALISEIVFEKCENLLEKRFEQADLSVIADAKSHKANLDLKEQLRKKLSSAK